MDKLLFNNVVNNIEYQIIEGLKIEFRDCLKELENVTDFSIDAKDNIYFILIKLKNYNLGEVKRIFHVFVRFAEYPEGTFYISTNNNESIEYELITFSSDKKGFYCQLKFISC